MDQSIKRPLRVLLVEDCEADAELIIAELSKAYHVKAIRTETEEEMRHLLDGHEWDVVLSDFSMPRFNAVAALHVLHASNKPVPFIIISGTVGEETAVAALKAGAADFLMKASLARLIPAIERERADTAERKARRAAEQTTREHEQRAVLELATAYEATLEGWVRALDLRDRETEGHSRRVTELTVHLARAMGFGEDMCVHIRRGALLHDIGKMAIPDKILLKESRLTPEEWHVMRRHPAYARDLLAPIEYLRPALDIPYGHHEKWDGTGYPRGLKGETIPLVARMFAAVDIWDAVRSDRPYRRAWPDEQAHAYIVSLKGNHLDPEVVDAFLSLLAGPDVTHRLQAHPTDDAEGRRTKTILVVDDYVSNVTLLKRWLTSDGYAVLTADSGTTALALIEQHHTDLILLDVEIPEPNGFAVCRCVKQNPATLHIPVIVLSGLDPSASAMAAREVGADDYLTKPIDPYALRSRVRSALERDPQADPANLR